MAKRITRRPEDGPELVRRDGGLCAAFVNTASPKRRALASYGDLLVWGWRSGVVGADDARRLERAAGERPGEAAATFERALALREVVARLLLSLAAGESPAAADLDALNGDLSSALANRRLVPAGGTCRWAWNGGDDLGRVLWPVVLSAAELLAADPPRRVRRCAADDCDLIFVDRTSGSPRRWCGKRCGNRVHSMKHYHGRVKPERREMRARARLRGRL